MGKADEVIRIRNEGAVSYDAMIREHGLEAARQMLISRVGTKCTVHIKPDEYNQMIEATKTAVVNTYLTLIYTTLHDVCGYGPKRLKRFKEAFDAETALCYVTDHLGRRYATVRDCAEEINRLADMGIDVEVVADVEGSADSIANRRATVSTVIDFLRDMGEKSAADALWEEVYGRPSEIVKARTKEQRAIAKQRKRADRRYIEPDMNLFDPEVSRGYLAIFASALTEMGMTDETVAELSEAVNTKLQSILDGGKAVQDGMVKELEEKHGITFE